MKFRENLLHLRDAHHMTQEQLAMLLGVTRQAVSKWEAGRATPDMDKLVRLSEVFEVDLNTLIQGDVADCQPREALVIPGDAPVTDVVGFDEHMRARAILIALGVGFAAFGVLGFFRMGGPLVRSDFGGWGPTLSPFPSYFLLTGLAGSLVCFALAHIGHVSFSRDHPFVIDFYTSDDHKRAQRLALFSRVAALVLAGIGVAIALIQSVSLQHLSGGGSSLVVCLSASVLMLMYGNLMVRRIDVASYNERTDAPRRVGATRVRFACVVVGLTLAIAFGSLFFVMSAWLQILLWGAVALAVGWAFLSVVCDD